MGSKKMEQGCNVRRIDKYKQNFTDENIQEIANTYQLRLIKTSRIKIFLKLQVSSF